MTWVQVDCGGYKGVGYAKYNWQDEKCGLPWSSTRGWRIAFGRAIADAAKGLLMDVEIHEEIDLQQLAAAGYECWRTYHDPDPGA